MNPAWGRNPRSLRDIRSPPIDRRGGFLLNSREEAECVPVRIRTVVPHHRSHPEHFCWTCSRAASD